MTVPAAWPSWLLSTLLLAQTGVGAQSVKSPEETLRQLERDWHAAVLQNDVEFVESLLAEEFVVTYDDGSRGDKQRELSLVAAFNQQIDAWSMDEFLIQVHGNTAVVHFTLRLIGPVLGEPVELAFRYIDVWIFRDGKWQCVASQSTRMRQKQ